MIAILFFPGVRLRTATPELYLLGDDMFQRGVRHLHHMSPPNIQYEFFRLRIADCPKLPGNGRDARMGAPVQPLRSLHQARRRAECRVAAAVLPSADRPLLPARDPLVTAGAGAPSMASWPGGAVA